MKVSAIVICLALVPFVAAQAPAAEEEPASFWGWFGGLFETEPAVTIQEKAQTVIDKVKDVHTKVNEFIVDLEIPPIPGEDNYPTAEELDAKIRELMSTIEQRVQVAVDSLDFDAWNQFGEEPEPEPEMDAEPEPEPVRESSNKWSWW